MIRLSAVALIFLFPPAAAWSAPPTSAEDATRKASFHLPPSRDYRRFGPSQPGRTQIAPNAHFGVGVFGLKSERTYLQPVTGREIDRRKQRRAAVGLSVTF
jgi:hypothetical protein